MPDPRESQSVINEAEQAAARGDFPTAERLLREAIALQEDALGKHHPGLANTLNNLGVVCERTNNAAEAEKCYRRAYAIAKASLGADHPSVITSGKNLRDFCNARGIPFEPPAPAAPASAIKKQEPAAAKPAPPATKPALPVTKPTAPAAKPVAPAAAKAVAPAPKPPAPVPKPEPPARPAPPPAVPVKKDLAAPSSRPFAVAGLIIGALVVLIFLAGRSCFSTREEAKTQAPVTTERVERSSAPPPAPAAPRIEPPGATAEPAELVEPAEPPKEKPAPAVKTPSSLTIVDARICRDLSTANWRCVAVESPVAAGSPLFFYTRIKSARNTTVEHRWYRGDRLHQAVELPIQANPGNGYRTFSRNTINAERAGDWRVELRAEDGTVLHEERFTVR